MGFSFLAPYLLSGLALLAAPWLIHQIRRPERETMRFGSLMFLPKVKREVIERRNLQHLLLMLLRMSLIALPALAFSRPYQRQVVLPNASDGQARHVILFDTSYSMGVEERWKEAQSKALELLRSIPPDERVAVVAFADSPAVLEPLFADGVSTAQHRTHVEQAVKSLRLSEGGTAYLPALQTAQELLMQNQENTDELQTEMIVHLISDFQSRGMPAEETGWKLSPRITLNSIVIGNEAIGRGAIAAIYLQETMNQELRIVGQVKSLWADDRPSCPVKLFLNEQEIAQKTVYVQAGNSTNVSFSVPIQTDQIVQGRLEIGDDALLLDNKRYFAWNPRRKKELLLAATERTDRTWTASWLLRRALHNDPHRRWTIRQHPMDALVSEWMARNERPDLVVLCDVGDIPSSMRALLHEYMREGGKVLLMLGDRADPDSLNTDFFDNYGLKLGGVRFAEMRESQFEMLSWIDFAHPVFSSFQTSEFNDFSQIRFMNYMILERMDAATDAKVKPLARFERDENGAEALAMAEIDVGNGRMIVWPFSPDLLWTNLPRNTKFVPLLFETLRYLDGADEESPRFQVGERIIHWPNRLSTHQRGIVQLPEESAETIVERDQLRLHPILLKQAGFLRWRGEEADTWESVYAVNIDADESDLTRIPLDEFERKLCSTSYLEREAFLLAQTNAVDASDSIQKNEFGYHFIILLMIGFMVESGYASWLARKKSEATRTEE